MASILPESPDRVFAIQTTELPLITRPENYDGGAPVRQTGRAAAEVQDTRIDEHILPVFNRDGKLVENWSQYNKLFGRPHRLVMDPYDPERHLWLVDDGAHVIYKFTNDGKKLVMTLGEFRVPGTDRAGGNGISPTIKSQAQTATGQHCPEGWTLYPTPGPHFKGVTESGSADSNYYNWVDQFDTLGLGQNVPIATGNGSDALLALMPSTGQWVVMRVPHPMGFFAKGLDGRIDNPNTGWKGKGVWTTYATRTPWHIEGGKGTTSKAVHFQIRPDPLAK